MSKTQNENLEPRLDECDCEDATSQLSEDAHIFNGCDCAIIGTTINGHAIYCYHKLVEHFQNHSGMTEQEAIDWVQFNILGAEPTLNLTIMFPID